MKKIKFEKNEKWKNLKFHFWKYDKSKKQKYLKSKAKMNKLKKNL